MHRLAIWPSTPQGTSTWQTRTARNTNPAASLQLAPNSTGTWTAIVLHTFNPNNGDGIYPGAGVVLDTAGNCYGTTSGGGIHGNYGIVYKLAPGWNGQWA